MSKRNDIEQQLKGVGLQDIDVRKAMEPWVNWTAFDLANKACEELRTEFSRLERHANDDQKYEVKVYGDRLKSLHLIAPMELKSIVESLLRAAPLIDQSRLDQFRSRANPWLAELEYLTLHADLPKPSLLLAEKV